eukprot:scaffold48_cov122-Skeletonema_menzelii.AAC.7
MVVSTKELFDRLISELEKRRKVHEKDDEEEKKMTMIDETPSSSSLAEASSDINELNLNPPSARRKKPRRSSPSPLSSSLYSSLQLPAACLNEDDGCDEAELLARAKRCEEILKLSQQAKEAEAERIRIANIKPLVWAKPTFDLDSTTTADIEDATADASIMLSEITKDDEAMTSA